MGMGHHLAIVVDPDEHMPGRAVIGRADDGDLTPLAYSEFSIIPSAGEPPDPVRPSTFEDYETDTGVYGAGIKGSRVSVASYINPYQKNATKWQYNENVLNPVGKPAVIFDNRGRVLDGRTQFPGQQGFRYDTNIPRPAYMSFSDLLDQEGVY
jgi:hypothetical protein